MDEKAFPDFSGLGGLLENWQATQKKFLPSGQVMTQLAEAMRTISQAQMTYAQTVMRANSTLLAAMWETCGASPMCKPETDERADKTTTGRSGTQAP